MTLLEKQWDWYNKCFRRHLDIGSVCLNGDVPKDIEHFRKLLSDELKFYACTNEKDYKVFIGIEHVGESLCIPDFYTFGETEESKLN